MAKPDRKRNELRRKFTEDCEAVAAIMEAGLECGGTLASTSEEALADAIDTAQSTILEVLQSPRRVNRAEPPRRFAALEATLEAIMPKTKKGRMFLPDGQPDTSHKLKQLRAAIHLARREFDVIAMAGKPEEAANRDGSALDEVDRSIVQAAMLAHPGFIKSGVSLYDKCATVAKRHNIERPKGKADTGAWRSRVARLIPEWLVRNKRQGKLLRWSGKDLPGTANKP